jgi:hypothetical protein
VRQFLQKYIPINSNINFLSHLYANDYPNGPSSNALGTTKHYNYAINATLSPGNLRINGIHVEMSNRVTREYSADRFLRIHFSEATPQVEKKIRNILIFSGSYQGDERGYTSSRPPV